MAAPAQVVRMQRNLKATREDQRKNVLCKFNGRCTNAMCNFRHDPPKIPQRDSSEPVLCQYHQMGNCRFGIKCQHYHDKEEFYAACAQRAPAHSKAHPQSAQPDDEIVLDVINDEPEQAMRSIPAPVQAQQQPPRAGPAQPAPAPAPVKASQPASNKRSAVSGDEEGEQAGQKRSAVWARLSGRNKKSVPDSKLPVAERLSREPPSAAMLQAGQTPSSAGPTRRPTAPGGAAMLLNRAMEAAERHSPAPAQPALAAQGLASSPFQAIHVQQQSNGPQQQQQQQQPVFGDPAGRWQGFQHPANTGPHMVSNTAALRARNAPVSEQRLTSRMSQMQMDPGPHPASGLGPHPHVQAAQQNHPGGSQRQPQAGSGGGRGRGRGRGRQGNAPPSVSLANAPPLGGGTPSHASNSRDGTANGLANRVGKGSGNQAAPLKPASKANAGRGQAQGSERKRKSDDEGSAGDPPTSKRKVASSSQAMAGASPSTGEAAGPSSTGDWMAAAEEKLQRAKAARAANIRAVDGSSSPSPPRGQAQPQPSPSQSRRAAATASTTLPSSSQQPMAIDGPAASSKKYAAPVNAQSCVPAPHVPASSVQAPSAVVKNTSAAQESQAAPPAEAAPVGDMDDTLRTLQMLLEQG